ETVAALALALEAGDLLYAAADEPAAMVIARALTAAAPEALTLFCPTSDALPGDGAPASPANVGRRVSALRQAGTTLAMSPRPRIALITTGEALARAYPPPAQY